MVRRIKTEVSAIRPGLWITAAVWPYYLDKWGWGLSEGYHDYYQDSKGWLTSGVVDAIAPMLYTGVSDDFERWQILMDDFLAYSVGNPVYPGIGADYDDFEAIVQRIEATRQASAGQPARSSFRQCWNREQLERYCLITLLKHTKKVPGAYHRGLSTSIDFTLKCTQTPMR